MTARCINCGKVKPVHKHVEGAQYLGPRGIARKHGVDWCRECWDENVAMNDRYRAEQDAKNQRLLAELKGSR